MPSPAQIIQGLPLLSWRNLQWPHVESAPIHGSHTQAERRYPYIDAAGHDNTGRDPLKIKVRMYFLETLEKGAFTKKWPVWRKALFDGSSGPLNHPIVGAMRARIEEWDIQFVAQTTAGIIVDVSFTETIDNIDKPNKFREPTPGGITVAKAASTAASAYGIKFPSGKLGVTLEDSMSSLFSGAFLNQVSFNSFAEQLVGNIEEMIAQAETLTDPKAYVAYDSLVFAWSFTKDAIDKASKDLRATGKRITQADTTIAAFAADVGNTEDEIMQLNLALLRSPVIPTGTAVAYYTGK